MRVHLIHGFNVSDGGAGSVGNLRDYLDRRGIDYVLHDYGWVGPFLLRLRNRKTVEELMHQIQDGDVLVGHSNGCAVCWKLIEAGAKPSAVVTIQPALRRDTLWPSHVKVLNLWNPSDYAVRAGRLWSDLVSILTPGRHYWGAAGHYGYTSNQPHVEQWCTTDEKFTVPTGGHSDALRHPHVGYWGPRITRWIDQVTSPLREKIKEA